MTARQWTRVVSLLVALVVTALVARGRDRAPSVERTAPLTASEPASTTPNTAPRASGGISRRNGFRSRDALDDHFAKHGAEFGARSAAEYLALAQALRDTIAGGDILEIVRTTDGVVSRFDRRTGAFVAFDRNGTLRTFFRPNDGEAYFQRQAKRRPSYE
jgi:hypothetical protein